MNDHEKIYEVAECIAAMDTMRHLICGMYGKLEEEKDLHVKAVEAFSIQEKRLRDLVEQLPNDAITLDTIRQSAATVEAIALQMPKLIRSEIDRVGDGVSNRFILATEKHIAAIELAAKKTTEAVDIYIQSASWSQWKTSGLAAGMSIFCVGIVAVGFWLWLPSYSEIQSLRAERDRLQLNVAQLEKSGGRLDVGHCGDRICAIVDEAKSRENWRDTKTNEVMVILKQR